MMKKTRAETLLLTILSQIWPALIVSLSSFSDGMQFGWSAPALQVLQSNNNSMHIEKGDEFWLEASFLLAALLGLPLSTYLTEAIGRRNTIHVGSVVALAAWCIIGFTNELKYLYLGRVLGGITGSMCYVATVMYLTEIARPDIRGFLTSLDHLLCTLGTLFVYSVVPFSAFYVHAVAGAALSLIQLIILPFLPQSPYYLLQSGRVEVAKNALRRLRNNSDNEEEFNEIVAAVEAEPLVNKNRFCLKKQDLKVLLLITLLLCFQQFTGFTVMQMNIIAILKDVSTVFFLSNEYVAIIFYCIVLFSTVVQTVTVDKLGRKKIFIISAFCTGICSFLIGICFGVKSEFMSWTTIAIFLLYAVFERLGLGYLPQLLSAELLPAGIKAAGIAYEDFLFRILAVCALGFYHYFGNWFGMNVPFFVFSGVSFLSGVYAVFVIPETSGKSLKQTQEIIS
ncbi:facilitated trehalose transporter Tret1-like [Zophobas morio]|uniref:facilitated trehalose transporter Tret1-like n=1 Tax=Zophobas morio TaxID=2755281 RepID=UPI0030832C7C